MKKIMIPLVVVVSLLARSASVRAADLGSGAHAQQGTSVRPVLERPPAERCKPVTPDELRRDLLKALYEEKKQVLKDEALLKTAEAQRDAAYQKRNLCGAGLVTTGVLAVMSFRYASNHVGTKKSVYGLLGGSGLIYVASPFATWATVDSHFKAKDEQSQIDKLKAAIQERRSLIDNQIDRAQEIR
jgi:hypothetical protein